MRMERGISQTCLTVNVYQKRKSESGSKLCFADLETEACDECCDCH